MEDLGITSWVLWNPRSVYQRGSLRSKDGTAQQTINNFLLAVEHLEPWKSQGCWYDVVRERHMVGARPVEEDEDR